MASTATSCLGDDLVLALVENTLTNEERSRVTTHIGECESCRKLVAETARAFLPQSAMVSDVSTLKDPDATKQHKAMTPEALFDHPKQIGRYQVLEPIGVGGMGVVYAAHDPQLDRRIALKLIRPDQAQDDSEARLLREAQAMARVSHPNVVAVHDAGTYEHQVFVAMELVSGTTLAQWLREKPRSWQESLEVLIHAGQGLAAAHAAGLVHRDFKPQNVLLGKDGRVRVTDFGLARPAGPSTREREVAAAPQTEEQSLIPQPTSSLIHMSMTRTGAVVGTPAYMAPEQFLAEPTDARTDQFSFCVAAYEALYGERPFRATSYELQLKRVLAGLPKVSTDTERAVPQWIREVLIRGLAPTSEERFPDMAALLRALDSPPEKQSPPLPREVRQWMLPVVIGSTIAVIAAMILVSFAPWNTRAAPVEQEKPNPVVAVEKPAPTPAPVAAAPAPIAAPPPPAPAPAPAPVVAAKKVRKNKAPKPTTAKPTTPADDSKLKPFND